MNHRLRVIAVGVAALAMLGASGAGAVWARDHKQGSKSSCGDGPPPAAGVQVSTCLDGTGAVDHSVTASYDPGSQQGYAVYQGRPDDSVAPAGYLGVDTQHGLTLVGCDTGTYRPGAPDEWNQRPDGPNNNGQIAVGTDEFTAPTGPVGPGDPCSPFVPHTPPGTSCGSPAAAPATSYPGSPSPLNAYTTGSPPPGSGQAGIAGDFGGGDGASGYLQVTRGSTSSTSSPPSGNVTTGGNSRGGGGTVAVGNDGHETDDPYTPADSPIVVCQD